MTDLDHYQVLGLPVNAKPKEIRKRYKYLCQKYHPDKDPANAEQFMRIRKAYDVLFDLKRKVIYDQGLRQGINPEEFRVNLHAIINKLLPQILNRLIAHGGNFEQCAQFELTTFLSTMVGERAKIKEAQRIITKHITSIKSGHDSYFVQALTKKHIETNVAIKNCDVNIAVIKFLTEDTNNITCEDELEQRQRLLGGQVFFGTSST